MTSVSGIVSLFETAVKCYSVISEAVLASKHERNLYYKFRIEEARFVLWGRSWGYSQGLTDSDQLEEQLNGSAGLIEIIRAILEHIINTLTNAEKLKSRFGFATETLGLDPHSSGFSFASFQNLDPLINPRKVSPKIDDDYRRSVSLIMSSRWSVSNKSTFMLFTKDMKDFNDGIYALLLRTTQETLGRALPAEILSSTEEVGELRVIAETASEEYPRLQETADLKRVSVEKVQTWADEGTNLAKTLEIEEDSLNLGYIAVDSPHPHLIYASRGYTSYFEPGKQIPSDHDGDGPCDSGDDVSIEWRSYTPTPEVFSRVDSLARLLHATPKPPDMRVLECIGWLKFSDSGWSRVIFVYKRFEYFHARRSLHTLLDKLKLPPLGDRFSLAKTLVRAVLQIHSAGWLHGDIRSNNIIFYSTNPGSWFSNLPSHWKLESPYISNFSFSNEWEPILVDHKMPYHHPNYNPNTSGVQPLGPNHGAKDPTNPIPTSLQPFKQEYDVYSLGCVLLEVGLWARLDRMYKPGPGWNRKLREHVKELGGKCGATYQSIVEWCLMINRNEGPKDGEALKEFVWEVLDKLENLRA